MRQYTHSALIGERMLSCPFICAFMPVERQPALLAPSNVLPSEDNLCAVPWLFVLGTGHSGSTSLLEALNALPGVQLAGKGATTIFSAIDLYRRFRFSEQNQMTSASQGESSTLSENEMLFSLQKLFLTSNMRAGADLHNHTIMRGFKELILPASLNYPIDPKHLGVGADRDVEWLAFIDKLFPCARMIFNTRHNVGSLSESDFIVQSLRAANERVRTMHAARIAKPGGALRSFLIEQENFSDANFTKIANWLGFSSCSYSSMLHASQDWKNKASDTFDVQV